MNRYSEAGFVPDDIRNAINAYRALPSLFKDSWLKSNPKIVEYWNSRIEFLQTVLADMENDDSEVKRTDTAHNQTSSANQTKTSLSSGGK